MKDRIPKGSNCRDNRNSSTSLLPGEPPVVTIEEAPLNARRIFATVDVHASSDGVWNVLTAYEKLQRVVPSLVKNDVLFRTEEGGARLSQVWSPHLEKVDRTSALFTTTMCMCASGRRSEGVTGNNIHSEDSARCGRVPGVIPLARVHVSGRSACRSQSRSSERFLSKRALAQRKVSQTGSYSFPTEKRHNHAGWSALRV